MSFIRWTFFLLFWGALAAFLHYTLPQYDVARITDTEVRRIDPGTNSLFWAQADAGSDGTLGNRDVFFISAVRDNGRVMVYRNEDTAWGWPPYFKFNSSNLQAQAADLRSTAADPQWVLIKHYGWRTELFTIFPNTLSVERVEGPDVRVINWTSIIVLSLLALLFWSIWVRWKRFRENRLDPALEEVGDGFADASDAVSEQTSRFKRWLKGS